MLFHLRRLAMAYASSPVAPVEWIDTPGAMHSFIGMRQVVTPVRGGHLG